jgi:hypothetical protein
VQIAVSRLKCLRDFNLAAGYSGGIRDTPMRRRRFSRPYRTGFACGIVANRKDEIELRRIGLCELIPRLLIIIRCVVAEPLQELDRARIHLPFRLAAGAIGVKLVTADIAQNSFGHDGTRGVARAKKKHIVRIHADTRRFPVDGFLPAGLQRAGLPSQQ